MSITLTPDGFLLDLWRYNKRGEQVYPYLVKRRGGDQAGLDVTVTGTKTGYQLMDLDAFIDRLAAGDFDEVGRMRMKLRTGGSSGGFAIREAELSSRLQEEVARRRLRRDG